MKRVDLTNLQGASSVVARDINRRILLNLIRSRQPVSRADLARLSGLQRSTVSLITEQLVSERWVIEGPRGRLPRGRRPTFLRLNVRRLIEGIDIRPVQTTVVLADVNGHFISQEVMATPSDPKIAIDELILRVRHLMSARPDMMFEGIGISLPGRFDLQSQRLVFAPNLKWPDYDLRTPIARDRFGRRAGERRQRLRLGGSVVRSEGWHPRPGGGHRFRGHRHGHFCQWPVGPGPARHGGRIRPPASIPPDRRVPAADAVAGRCAPRIAPRCGTSWSPPPIPRALAFRTCWLWRNRAILSPPTP